jgi:hypothetical protein
MTNWLHPARVHTYEEAVDYLSRGRNKDMRPLYHMGLFIKRLEPGNESSNIAIGYFNTYNRTPERYRAMTMVIFREDGLVELPGWNTWSGARRAMVSYSNLMGMRYSRGNIKLRQPHDTVKKRSRRPCKVCHGMTTWFEREDSGNLKESKCHQCIDGWSVSRDSIISDTWPQQQMSIYSDWNKSLTAVTVYKRMLVNPQTHTVIGFVDHLDDTDENILAVEPVIKVTRKEVTDDSNA